MNMKAFLKRAKSKVVYQDPVEMLVKKATDSNSSGPEPSVLKEIEAACTQAGKYVQVMSTLSARLHEDGAKWRKVYKALIVLGYLVSANSIKSSRDRDYWILQLQDLALSFFYKDPKTRADHGRVVRTKAAALKRRLEEEVQLSRSSNFEEKSSDTQAAFKRMSDFSGPEQVHPTEDFKKSGPEVSTVVHLQELQIYPATGAQAIPASEQEVMSFPDLSASLNVVSAQQGTVTLNFTSFDSIDFGNNMCNGQHMLGLPERSVSTNLGVQMQSAVSHRRSASYPMSTSIRLGRENWENFDKNNTEKLSTTTSQESKDEDDWPNENGPSKAFCSLPGVNDGVLNWQAIPSKEQKDNVMELKPVLLPDKHVHIIQDRVPYLEHTNQAPPQVGIQAGQRSSDQQAELADEHSHQQVPIAWNSQVLFSKNPFTLPELVVPAPSTGWTHQQQEQLGVSPVGTGLMSEKAALDGSLLEQPRHNSTQALHSSSFTQLAAVVESDISCTVMGAQQGAGSLHMAQQLPGGNGAFPVSCGKPHIDGGPGGMLVHEEQPEDAAVFAAQPVGHHQQPEEVPPSKPTALPQQPQPQPQSLPQTQTRPLQQFQHQFLEKHQSLQQLQPQQQPQPLTSQAQLHSHGSQENKPPSPRGIPVSVTQSSPPPEESQPLSEPRTHKNAEKRPDQEQATKRPSFARPLGPKLQQIASNLYGPAVPSQGR